MKKYIIIAILCGIVWYIHYINPTFEDHMDFIDAETSYDAAMWEDLDYKDYALVSFTNSRKKISMVSFGLCNYVKVVDEDWAEKQGKGKGSN